MTWYISIRSDEDHARFTETAPLVEFLAKLPELRQTGSMAFAAAEGQPWVTVVLVVASGAGNYVSDGTFVKKVNLIELMCSEFEDPTWYRALAARIAARLGWEAVASDDE